MPSTCPKCHEVVAEDVICCADLEYRWKCRSCSKVCQGMAVPYGKCFLCGGNLERGTPSGRRRTVGTHSNSGPRSKP